MDTRDFVATLIVVFTFSITPAALAQTAEGCGVCHSAIYKEWAASPHAESWNSTRFQQQMASHGSEEFCGQCHAPVSIWQEINLRPATPEGSLALPSSDTSSDEAPYEALIADQLSAREHELEEGVYCGSCHFIDVIRLRSRGSDYIGPYHTEEGHEGRQVDAFREYRLCAACHGKGPEAYQPSNSVTPDYQHAGAVAIEFNYSSGNCGSCHMPQRKEKLVQLNIFEGIPERSVGSHTFTGDRYSRLADALEFSVAAGELVIENTAMGHPLRIAPDSSYRIELSADQAGLSHTIQLDDAGNLAPGQTSNYALPGSQTAERWSLELFHLRKGEEERSILKTELK